MVVVPKLLLWCSSFSIYSQSRHCKHCKYFGDKAVRTWTQCKFGKNEKGRDAEVKMKQRETKKKADWQKAGGACVVISMKSHVSHAALNLNFWFSWRLCHVRPQGAASVVSQQLFPHACMQKAGTDKNQHLAVTCWWFQMPLSVNPLPFSSSI